MTLEIKSERRNLTFGSGEPAITHEEAINTLKEFLRAEQIAGMSRHVCTACEYEYDGSCDLHRSPGQCHNATCVAEALYNAGYRKQSDIINDFVNRLKEKPIIYRVPLLGLSTRTEIEDYADDFLKQFSNAINAVAEDLKGGT